ncbi:MAG: hypothetical protein JW852_01655 [Spirochaetales bacterium]|nr:hypothetical protein [Spirochaetales bacterium]
MATSSSSENVKPKNEGRSTENSTGFFSRLLNYFASSADPEREKKRRLKEIEKILKKQRYKFYRPKTGEVLPALARFFYDIYKAVASAHVLVEHAEASSVLKTIVIEHFLSEKQREILGKFEEESVKQRAQQIPAKDLAAEYKEYIASFFSSFDSQLTSRIDATYNLLDVFLQIIHFDYYFLIKKFDSRIAEGDFRYKPRFEQINGEYVSNDLKDFMEILPLVDERQDWQTVLSILQVYKGTEVISPAQLKTVTRSIMDVRRTGILTLIVRHIDGDPYYKAKSTLPKHKIVEDHHAKLKTRIEMTIQKVINERRKSQIDELAEKVFDTAAVSRLRNYTEKANLSFSQRMLGGYVYVAPLNYLCAFLLDYLKGEIKFTIDLLLIRGQWAAAALSQQLSEPYHRLVELTDQLLAFDESLAEDGEKGAVIQNALHKSGKDKGMIRVLKQHLSDVNGEALQIVKESAQYLVAVAKYLKAILNDHKSQPPEIILNWREIETASDRNIDKSLSSMYGKIYYFTQLIQQYLKG